MNIIDGGITSAKGFAAAQTAAGIKYKTGRDDMAMIASKLPCHVAGTFTTNVVKAAPVIWDRDIVKSGKDVYAVVINAGIANACTGEEGMRYCLETGQAVSEVLSVEKEGVLVASTGVIGMQLPIEKITAGVKTMAPKLQETREAGHLAAKAIMTTDTKEKEVAVTMILGGKTVTLGGMCKGSGMIHPNMCTMLCFLTTDAAISKTLMQKALSEVIEDTFNMVSVDGDTSTNDTVLLLANGAAGNTEITTESEDYRLFKEALFYVGETIAKKIASDGEGATKLFTTKILHAETKKQAKVFAKSVITSSLTKAMIFGQDANCGRIMCALGYSGENFDPNAVDLFIKSKNGSIQLIENGVVKEFSEEEAKKIFSADEVTAIADMKQGEAEATAWGCDLTFDYVKINADYRS